MMIEGLRAYNLEYNRGDQVIRVYSVVYRII